MNYELNRDYKLNIKYQVILAIVLVYWGVVLIVIALFLPPMGYIDPTVLTAFGEILTFAGSIMGLDYHYRMKTPPQPSQGRGDS